MLLITGDALDSTPPNDITTGDHIFEGPNVITWACFLPCYTALCLEQIVPYDILLFLFIFPCSPFVLPRKACGGHVRREATAAHCRQNRGNWATETYAGGGCRSRVS